MKSQNEAAIDFSFKERIARELWLRSGGGLTFWQCWQSAERYFEQYDAKYQELVIQPYEETKEQKQ